MLDFASLFGDSFDQERLVAESDERVLYMARDQILKRNIALRVQVKAGSHRDWFVKETEVLAMLDHPAIRHVYSAAERGGYAYRVGNWIDEPAKSPPTSWNLPPRSSARTTPGGNRDSATGRFLFNNPQGDKSFPTLSNFLSYNATIASDKKLGEYQAWITTATKSSDPHQLMPFDPKPASVRPRWSA